MRRRREGERGLFMWRTGSRVFGCSLDGSIFERERDELSEEVVTADRCLESPVM